MLSHYRIIQSINFPLNEEMVYTIVLVLIVSQSVMWQGGHNFLNQDRQNNQAQHTVVASKAVLIHRGWTK
jgi:hypothetical protein